MCNFFKWGVDEEAPVYFKGPVCWRVNATKGLCVVCLLGTKWRNKEINQLTGGKLAGSSIKSLECRNWWKQAAWAPVNWASLITLAVILALCLVGVFSLSVLLWKQWGTVADSVISADLKAHTGFLHHPSIFCTLSTHRDGVCWSLSQLALEAMSTLDRSPYRRASTKTDHHSQSHLGSI